MPDPVNITPSPDPAPAPAPAAAPASPVPGATPALQAQYDTLKAEHEQTAAVVKQFKEYFPDATPADVKQGVDWAVNIYKQVQSGQLVPKTNVDARAAALEAPAENQAPWKSEGWDLLPAATQAERVTEWQEKKINGIIDSKEKKFREEANQQAGLLGRQQNILLKAIQAAIKNPNTDISAILQKASEAANTPAEALIDQIVEAASRSPEAEEARINKLVEERLALRQQERDNEQLNLMSNSSRIPRGNLAPQKMSVADENRSIIKKLADKGIRLQ